MNKEGKYKLFVSHNLGADYSCEYSTDDKDDPELKRRIEEAAKKVLRYYVEGDDDVMCKPHKDMMNFLCAPGTKRTIEQQAELLRNKFCK